MKVLEGRTVTVMGASGGLGPVAAEAAAEAGARVILVDLNPEIAARAAQVLTDDGYGDAIVRTYGLDLTHFGEVKQFAHDLRDSTDIIWHLVGGWRGGKTLPHAPANDLHSLRTLLVDTTWNVVRAFAPTLAHSQRGRFALVSSPMADRPTSTNAAYGAMKAAAEALTLALADELADSGATANIVRVKALLTRTMAAKEPDKPRPGFVHVDDVAAALVWLATDAAATMNGQRLSLTPPV